MAVLATLVSGLLFGLGLIVSGLANPAKVLNFLDIAGSWDPSLAFTMGAAVATTAVGFLLVQKRARPLFAERFYLPDARDADARLLTGAAVFGIGWGLAGYCPGPAVTAITIGGVPTLIFLSAMLAGMWLSRFWFGTATTTPARPVGRA